MRKEFSKTVEDLSKIKPNLVFLTGDLGFMALENIREAMGDRFINAGVSEQNMMSVAAAIAHEGQQVICYSIAPFAVFRPAEQIRLDICLHKKNVKIVGNGGGYGYGIMGSTHHAIEDIAVISSFQHMHCYIPFCNEDVEGAVKKMLEHDKPSYLRLGFGVLPEHWHLSSFAPIRKVSSGHKITIAGMGPILNNIAPALENRDDADVFAVAELPLNALSADFIDSVKNTGKLLVVEEHIQRGGLGEHLALHLALAGVHCEFVHCHAKGYENGLTGSPVYHHEQNGLDVNSLSQRIKSLIYGRK